MILHSDPTVIQWNCRGLRNKIPELRQFTTIHPIPILCLSEAKCARVPSLKGYVAHEAIHLLHPPKLNSLIYVREDIPSTKITTLHVLDQAEINVIAVEIGHQRITIVHAYLRSGVAVNVDNLKRLLRSLSGPVLLVGDLNAHHPRWGDQRTNSRGEHLVKILDDLDYDILNDGTATFYSASDGSPGCLDLEIEVKL